MSPERFALGCVAAYWLGVASLYLVTRAAQVARQRRASRVLRSLMTSAEPPRRVLRPKYLPREALSPGADKRRVSR